ncbi:platelet-activating factor receptor isoform X1 [Alligator sinensis]|uniref:Platelet-activating factor receptor n=2 Tax=Alligator sinensis TaxID=38654 RepID=A0A1U8DE55_ALLSI|nr:platelet-activating factor receptor isoform X1 [Alligator sinensis]
MKYVADHCSTKPETTDITMNPLDSATPCSLLLEWGRSNCGTPLVPESASNSDSSRRMHRIVVPQHLLESGAKNPKKKSRAQEILHWRTQFGGIMFSKDEPVALLSDATTIMTHNISCQIDSEFRYTLFTIFYSVIFILGFIANCYVLWIFSRVYPARKLNEIKIIMVNLTVADLLFLVTLPLWIIYYYNRGDWIMPGFLCNVAGWLFFVNTYCSVAFLTVITYNRYQAVTKPIKAVQSSTRRKGIYISAAIWIVIAGSTLYYLFGSGVTEEKIGSSNVTRCFERYDSTGDNMSILAIHMIICIIFYIIFLVILGFNGTIIRTLLSKSAQPRRSVHVKQRAFWMVCTVLAVFVICFVPHHLIHLPWTLTVLEVWQKENCPLRQQLNDAHQVTLCLLSTNCVLDPIIYCFLTKKFRKHLSENFKSMKGSRKCSKQTTEIVIEGTIPLTYIPGATIRN